MRLNYSPPEHPEEFERLCLQLLRAYWKCPTLEIYATGGQKQFGVDIFDEGGGSPLLAAQCKVRQVSLTPAEIEGEVAKAKTFPDRIGRYAVLTTAKRSGEAQRAIRKINRKHKQEGLFTVEYFPWNKIKDLLHQYPEVAELVYGTSQPPIPSAFLERFDALSSSLEALVPERDTGTYHAEIDEAKHFIAQGDFQIARLLLTRLKERAWDRLDARGRFRVLTNIAAAHLSEAQFEKAAALFLEAKLQQPDDELACANEALAHQLLGNPQRAFEVASQHRERFPNSAKIVGVWVRNTPEELPVEELKTRVPDHLTNDPEVVFSLAIRAANKDPLEIAEAFALKAANLNPELAFSWLLLAKVTTKGQLAENLDRQGQLRTDLAVAGLDKAEEYSEKAVLLAKKEKAKGVLAEALMARGLQVRTPFSASPPELLTGCDQLSDNGVVLLPARRYRTDHFLSLTRCNSRFGDSWESAPTANDQMVS